MKKLLICALCLLAVALIATACNEGNTPADTTVNVPTDAPTDAPTEAPTAAPTDAPTDAPTEAPTDAPTEAPTDAPTEAPTDAPKDPVEPTALYTAEQLAAMTATNATVTLEGNYAHFLTGVADTATNPSITLTAEGEEFSDVIVIKYRTNCGSYGSNFWGTLLLNGTAEFNGNRRDSDNWFYYATDGSWNVLVLDMRKNKAGSEGTPDTDVTGGAAITSLVYNFFDYAGNGGKLTTADGGDEYFDIEYIAFFNTKEEAQSYAG